MAGARGPLWAGALAAALVGPLSLAGCTEAPAPLAISDIRVAWDDRAPEGLRVLVTFTLTGSAAASLAGAQLVVHLHEWPLGGNATVHTASLSLDPSATTMPSANTVREGATTWPPGAYIAQPATFSLRANATYTGTTGLYSVWVHAETHPAGGTVSARASYGCFNRSVAPFYGDGPGMACPWLDAAGERAGDGVDPDD